MKKYTSGFNKNTLISALILVSILFPNTLPVYADNEVVVADTSVTEVVAAGSVASENTETKTDEVLPETGKVERAVGLQAVAIPINCANGVSMTYEEFVVARDKGLVSYTLETSVENSQAVVHIKNDTDCTIPMSLSVYKMFDGDKLSTQKYFSGVDEIQATSSTVMVASIPDCLAQVDFWYGQAPKELEDNRDYDSLPLPVVLTWNLPRTTGVDEDGSIQGPYCVDVPPPPPACDINTNLIANSGFELPVVNNPAKWTSVSLSDLELVWTSYDTVVYPYVEIQAGYTEGTAQWTAHTGIQYAEIDGGINHDVSQVFRTIPGQVYTISYWASPRPNQSSATNKMNVTMNGEVINNLIGTGSVMTEWANYKHLFTATTSSTRLSFTQAQNDFKGEGVFLDDVSVFCGNKVTPPPPPISTVDINIIANKIVCDSETNLPNWGLGGPDVTENTVSQFLRYHPTCHLDSGWKFQWVDHNATYYPERSFIGEAQGWQTFGVTNSQGVATTTLTIPANAPYVWIREVLKENYLPFSFPDVAGNDPYSAEMYCHIDVLNYDNYERVDAPFVSGGNYYCVAFNVLKSGSKINTPPIITLVGNNPATTTVGQIYTDAGATAVDTQDGNLTSQIVVTGSVSASTTGTYILTYVVKDSGNLYATTTRTVIVEATSTPPVIPPPVNPPGGGGGGGGSSFSGGRRRPVVTGEVLGATSCYYLRDWLKIDWKNDPIEVLKLKSFLNVFEGESLSLTTVFDKPTFEAVERFQVKYRSDVLTPWGDKVTTGFVYILTKKKVNEIYCNSIFPVTSLEQNEIDNFRNSPSYYGSGIMGGNSGSNVKKIDFLKDALNESNLVIELKDSSSSTSVVRNVAVSLFGLPQRIFKDIGCDLLFWIILALLITIGILLRKLFKKNNKIVSTDFTTPSEPTVIFMPPVSTTSTDVASDIPSEEIIIENEDEEVLEEDRDLRN